MREKALHVEILTCEGCPHAALTYQRVREALGADGLNAEINQILVATAQAAIDLRFIGSPTVRINGEDVEPASQARTDYGLMCRMYFEGESCAGLPSETLLQRALRSSQDHPLGQSTSRALR